MEFDATKPSATPDFHDGSLTGIVLANGALELQCSTDTGERYICRLMGLRRLWADSFREGNIIFEMNIYAQDYPGDLVKRAFGEENVAEPVWLPIELERLKTARAALLELTASYGCELVALFDGGYSVERVSQ